MKNMWENMKNKYAKVNIVVSSMIILPENS